MKRFIKLSVLAVFAILSALSFGQGDAKALLKEINEFRSSKFSEIQKSGKQLDQKAFDAISAEVKSKAEAAIKGLDVAKIDAKDAYDWAQIFAIAEKQKEVCALARKFLTSSPAPEPRYQAQMLMMSACYELGEADMLASTLNDIKAPNAMSAGSLARTASYYAGTIAEKKGANAAIKVLDQVEKGMIYEDPQVIADRNFEAQKQRNAANPNAKPMTPEEEAKLKTQLLANAKAQNDSTRFSFTEAKAGFLLDAKRKDEALKLLDTFIASIPPESTAARGAKMFKTRLTLPGSVPPALDVKKVQGSFTSLDALKGKVVVVDTFAHWCGPCIASFPDMRKMYDDLKDKGLEIVGVTTWYGYYKAERPLDKDAEFARMADFMKEHNMNWPVVYGDRSNFEKLGVTGIPTVFLIGRDGKVVTLHIGYDKAGFAKFRKEVEEQVAKK